MKASKIVELYEKRNPKENNSVSTSNRATTTGNSANMPDLRNNFNSAVDRLRNANQ